MTAAGPARLLGMLLLLIAGVALPRDASAHEPGSTRVDVIVEATGAVSMLVPVDPVMLWRLRELDAGRVPAGRPDLSTLRGERREYEVMVQRAVQLHADGTPLPLVVQASDWSDSTMQVSTDTGVASVLVTLSTRLPPGTRAMTWSYALPVGPYPLRVLQPGRAEPQATWVVGDRTSVPLSLAPVGHLALARQYVWLGIVHILPRGLDHILFVLSLFLLAPRWRALLAQVSAFTAAHTLSLAATMVGWVSLPSSLVEPLIAASIVWVALENVWKPTLSRTRVAVVFLFGLLHGAGFAGVLADLGLPAGARILALFAFNAGVEVGQALVLVAAFATTAVVMSRPRTYRTWVAVPASLVIAAVGVYWTVERILA